jgi:hypothetical protein
MMKPANRSQQQMSLRQANYSAIQLGNTKGRMIAADEKGASFMWVDRTGMLCVLEWKEAIRRFGPPKTQ